MWAFTAVSRGSRCATFGTQTAWHTCRAEAYRTWIASGGCIRRANDCRGCELTSELTVSVQHAGDTVTGYRALHGAICREVCEMLSMRPLPKAAVRGRLRKGECDHACSGLAVQKVALFADRQIDRFLHVALTIIREWAWIRARWPSCDSRSRGYGSRR